MNEQMTVDEIRTKELAPAVRANTDATFLLQLRADPVGTLRAAGIPEAAISDLLNGPKPEADVAGYQHKQNGYNRTFCCCTFFPFP